MTDFYSYAGGLNPQSLLRQLQGAQSQANKANEARYQQILGMYDTLGKAGRTRIEQQATQAQARGTQDLTSRGLGNTTITSAVSRGVANDTELQRQQLEEGLTQQKAGVMERKTEQGPDLGMYAGLLQSAMAGAKKIPFQAYLGEQLGSQSMDVQTYNARYNQAYSEWARA